MEKMEALTYEHMIKRIFGSGRTSKNGADADIYRRYERARNLYYAQKAAFEHQKPPIRNASLEDLEYEMNVELRKVLLYIERAIAYAMKEHRHSLSNDQVNELNKYYLEVSGPNLSEVNSIIIRVNSILTEAGIENR